MHLIVDFADVADMRHRGHVDMCTLHRRHAASTIPILMFECFTVCVTPAQTGSEIDIPNHSRTKQFASTCLAPTPQNDHPHTSSRFGYLEAVLAAKSPRVKGPMKQVLIFSAAAWPSASMRPGWRDNLFIAKNKLWIGILHV